MLSKENQLQNLDRAKRILSTDESATCVLVSGETVYTSKKSGIAPILNFIESGTDLKNFSAADKVVGKAAALLFAYAGVKEVFAEVLSKKAIPVLKKFGICFSYETETGQIQNRQGNGICPMEEAVQEINSPNEAVKAIQSKLKDLQSPEK